MDNSPQMLFKQNEVLLRKTNKSKTESFSFLTLPLLLNFNFSCSIFIIKQNRVAYF